MIYIKIILQYVLPVFFFFSSLSGQGKDSSRELKRLNAKIDRVRVMVDSLELDNQILLPELMSAFKQAVKSKSQQDSITLVLLKRINTLSNKITKLETKSLCFVSLKGFISIEPTQYAIPKISTSSKSFSKFFVKSIFNTSQTEYV